MICISPISVQWFFGSDGISSGRVALSAFLPGDISSRLWLVLPRVKSPSNPDGLITFTQHLLNSDIYLSTLLNVFVKFAKCMYLYN